MLNYHRENHGKSTKVGKNHTVLQVHVYFSIPICPILVQDFFLTLQ